MDKNHSKPLPDPQPVSPKFSHVVKYAYTENAACSSLQVGQKIIAMPSPHAGWSLVASPDGTDIYFPTSYLEPI